MDKIVPKRELTFSGSDQVQIRIATNAGACFGVERALTLASEALKAANDRPVVSFGPLIHNPKVVADFAKVGLTPVSEAQQISPGSTVVIRSHGVPKELEKELLNQKLNLVDATCPLVKKPQRIAASIRAQGYFLVLVGDENHPEVRGVLSHYGGDNCLVTYSAKDIEKISREVARVAVVAQTTIEEKIFEEVVSICKQRFSEVVVYNTICEATSVRQAEAVELSKQAEIMIVVGGRNSSNTKKLEKICREEVETFLVEEIKEINPDWFFGKRRIGITGGASTPVKFVDQVGEYISTLVSAQFSQV